MTIEMAGVWKTFGEGHTAVHALKDVDLKGPQGEFAVILGPSGSGKTTLLNLVGAIDNATDGRIEVGGLDLATLDVDQQVKYRRENVGFVFQFFNLIPTLTASENVAVASPSPPSSSPAAAGSPSPAATAGRPCWSSPAPLCPGSAARAGRAISRAIIEMAAPIRRSARRIECR